jgi:hypothetical protein
MYFFLISIHSLINNPAIHSSPKPDTVADNASHEEEAVIIISLIIIIEKKNSHSKFPPCDRKVLLPEWHPFHCIAAWQLSK